MKPRKPLPNGELLLSVTNALANLSEQAGRKFRCTLVTPMYGGGVRAGKVDRDMPIRATAIRGQLRFWWRLLNRTNPEYADPRSLFEAERAIWGGLGNKDTLAASQIFIKVWQPRAATWRVENKNGGSALGKMIVTDANATAQWLVATNRSIEFHLEVRSNVCEESVLQALRMWATFGGVGARRRRGLGAIEVFDESENRVLATKADLESAQCKLYCMAEKEFGDYRAAVEEGVSRLIAFRQKPGLARGRGDGQRPGGSFWPEADAVRKLTGRARPKNADTLRDDRPLLFPRALLGLPIVFQFKPHEHEGDPHTCSLEVANDGDSPQDRFASPLIFGAFPESRGMKTIYRPAALLLPSHNELRRRPLKLKISDSVAEPIPADTWWPSDPAVRKNALPEGLRSKAGEKGDVLTAFINYFRCGEETP